MNARRTSTAVAENLGNRIRTIRNQRGMSLRSVAAQAQVSASLLSQIERGEASPSLVSLVAIADALVVTPGDLLADEARAPSLSPVVRAEERRVIEDPMCRREYLMHLDDPYLEVAELFVAPGGASRPALAKHRGRDYGIVLEGSVRVEFPHGREDLRRGDYIAFDSDEAHRIVNVSDAPARVLWIVVLGDGAHRKPAVPPVEPAPERG